MKRVLSLGLVVAVVAFAGVVHAELKSGLQKGEKIGVFIVEKVAGNPTDGVDEGQKLCYRCKLGNRPVVTVFTRTADENVAKLMKKLDGFVAHNESKKAASFVNLLGDNPKQLEKQADALVKKSHAKHVAVVVPIDHKAGPDNINLNPKAAVTVLIYKKGEIAANHAFAPGELNDAAIAKIMADTGKILN